jgi:hypothetical protein
MKDYSFSLQSRLFLKISFSEASGKSACCRESFAQTYTKCTAHIIPTHPSHTSNSVSGRNNRSPVIFSLFHLRSIHNNKLLYSVKKVLFFLYYPHPQI